jgi:hypothetical protein
LVEVEGDVADVTAIKDGNDTGKQFPKFQYGDKYPFLEIPDPCDEELFRRLAAVEMPPWEGKGRTTKAWMDLAENLSKDNGIIKKRFEGAILCMMIRPILHNNDYNGKQCLMALKSSSRDRSKKFKEKHIYDKKSTN